MKILILSDSHGQDLPVAKALDREWPIDAMIHLGDTQEDEDEFSEILAGEEVPLFLVRGNCDWYSSVPLDRIVELFIDNLGRYAKGKELRNPVDRTTGYRKTE